MSPGEQPGQIINPLDCMGEMPEALMRALMYARAALIQLQQRYATLQQQHEALGEAFDARGVEMEQLKAELAATSAALKSVTWTRERHTAPIDQDAIDGSLALLKEREAQRQDLIRRQCESANGTPLHESVPV